MIEEFGYEKIEKEGFKPFEAFKFYCLMGSERSYAKVSRKVGKNKKLIERWGKAYNWVTRAEQYDAFCDRKHQREMNIKIQAARKRHAEVGKKLVDIGTKRLSKMKDEDIDKLSPEQAAKIAMAGAELEREALGIEKKVDITSDGKVIQGAQVATSIQVEIVHSNKKAEDSE